MHRRRRAGLVFFSVLTLVLAGVVPAAGGEHRGPVQPGSDVLARDSWIVRLVPGASPVVEAPQLAAAAGGSVGLVYRNAINGFQLLGSAAAAAALGHNPRVASVSPDGPMFLNDLLPHGVDRVEAWDQSGSNGSYQQGFRGAGARIAVIDTGIDLDHPDLVSGIDVNLGRNCVDASSPPNDGYGHGTHVAGTAAAPYNGLGVVGVAPEARLVPVKVFDDAGNSSEALVLCGLDHVIGLNADGDAANDVDVVNMSFGEQRAWGDCATDPLHDAICRAYAAGLILVGGAGNSAVDAGAFVPAAYPEVVSVSALADFDGAAGGSAGCPFVLEIFWYECDDTFAFFSNFGPVDLIAPGVQEYSTWANGGYQTSSGTSMATPHVSGVAALVAAAAPGIRPDAAREALLQTGECPNGEGANADGVAGCGGQGTWPEDPDGVPEPLVNAVRAALFVASAPPPPPPGPEPPSAPALSATAGDGQVALSWSAPLDDGGSPITGYEIYRGLAPGTAALHATIGAGLAYSDTAVSNGTTYWYQVAAINTAGVGTRSEEVAATPLASVIVPSAPQNLSAQKQRDTILLTWAAPASDGGAAITRYVVRRSGGVGPVTYEVPGTQLSYVDSSLSRQTWYTYTVAAVNSVGEGPPSNQVRVRSR